MRDLKKGDVPWLKHVSGKLVDATVGLYEGVERDQIKLYVHCELGKEWGAEEIGLTEIDQPTYHHFHIHIVHVQLEAGATQSVGKALGLDNIISTLENLAGGDDAGMEDVSLTYHLGEASELWEKVFGPLKEGKVPDVDAF